jgi:hypothetical protein
MSYLDRQEAIEDLQREGLPPASDEVVNQVFESYYLSKIKRQADEIASLKIQLLELRRQLGEPETELTTSKLVRSYCGEEMEEDCWAAESFLALGAEMAAQAGVRIPMEETLSNKIGRVFGISKVAEVKEMDPQAQEERFIDKYNADRELKNLAVFLKFHHDCDQSKKLEPGCQELRRNYCGQHEEECIAWLLSDESSYWFHELFQRPPLPTPVKVEVEVGVVSLTDFFCK